MSLFKVFSKKQQVKKTTEFYSTQKTSLPENFAQNVLELQMRLEFAESYDLITVQQLNELYRIAIQYYIDFDTKKAQHFQKKLANLLTNPITLRVIQKKDQVKPIQKTNDLNNIIKQELGKFSSQAQTVIKNIVQTGEQKMVKSQTLIRQNIRKQQTDLTNRIIQRSRSRKRQG